MIDKNEQELKDLRDKIYALEDEMSVSTRNNIYCDDIRKSKRLLLYRYALLLQIKDIRKVRRNIENRIDRINTLKSLGARGRILTKRESQAINDVHNDVRRREDIVELYDNKKEVYSDKRLAYYGFDEELEEIFFKHQSEFEQYFDVTEKNVLELKEQLDLGHNIKENMSTDEILAANEERYGDEIVDFELGIIFDDDNKDIVIDLSEKDEKEITSLDEEINDEKGTSNEEKTKEELVLEKLLKLESELINDESVDQEIKKYNYNNGYNLFTEDMDRIILDSIDDEIAEDIANEMKTYSEDVKELLNKDYKEEKYKKEDFLTDSDQTIKENLDKKKLTIEDDKIFKNSMTKKDINLIKEKIILKEKLEEYINTKGNDMTREFYNNEIRNTDLNTDQKMDEIDKALNLDLYQLGILYEIDQKINELKKKDDGSDDISIKVLINKLYQIKMEYKLYPGYCFNDVTEYEPEHIVDLIRKFDDKETKIDVQEIYRAAMMFTISAEEVKQRYRKMYGLDRNTVTNIDNSLEDNKEEEIE